MARVTTLEHRGVVIHLVDLSDVAAEAYADDLLAAAEAISREPPQSVRLITYVKGARFGGGVAERVKAYSASIRPALRAGAVVGMSPLHRVIFSAVKPFLHASVAAFDDLDTAKDWLATLK